MTTARRLHYSYEDYLRLLEVSNVKLEYCDGEIHAMGGGTPAHADLAASITRLLGNALQGRGRVSSSDLKVRIEETDLSTFPDVTVTSSTDGDWAVLCGKLRPSRVPYRAIVLRCLPTRLRLRHPAAVVARGGHPHSR